ncbi:phage tail protein, partial [Escherichia coli]|nr:phage tail protein [Escherichia coli]
MANLPETPQWEDGIYQIEVSDPVLGGPDGISNRQGKQLASRTLYLKQQVEKGGSDLAKHIAAADPHTQYAFKESPVFTGTPTAPTPVNTDNSKKLATTEFVARVAAALAESVAGKLSLEQNGADILDPEEF